MVTMQRTDRILENVLTELEDKILQLKKISPHKTRADYLRMVRAAVEILPAVPKDYTTGEVYERPRGVVYD